MDWVRTAAHLVGWASENVHYNQDTQVGSAYITENRLTSCMSTAEKTHIGYSGKVYCVTVPSSLFLIRHKGHISVTGNCVAFLAGSDWYIEAHKAGNVHVEAARVFFPEHAAHMSKSWAKATPHPSNPGSSYYDMSKRLQHACPPGDCEVLTRVGWVRMDAFSGQEEIAIWAPDSRISWEIPLAWHQYDVSEELVHLQGRNIDFQCTAEHRLPMFNNRTGFYEKTAAQMPLTYGKMPACGLLEDSGLGPTESEARLLAATWADGCLRQDGWTVFGLKKARKLERIKELLEANGIEYRIWTRGVRQEGNQIACKTQLRKALGHDLLSWSRAAQAAFLDELPNWDGHRDPKQVCIRIFNTHKEELEIIATLCHLNGMMAKVVAHGKPRGNRQQCWMLYFRRAYRQSTDSPFPHISYASIKASKFQYSGKVFCPTTSTGWFLARRNGKIIVTGNSNYMQTPNGIARHAHITQREAKAAQGNYFRNMPEIPAYHRWIENEIKTKRRLVSPLGRVRQFLGRTWETTTVREAVSWQPQSCISDITKILLWRLWRHLDPDALQVLMEHHDSVLFQVRESALSDVMAQVLPLTDIPIPIGPRVLNSRWETKVGYNWDEMEDWTG